MHHNPTRPELADLARRPRVSNREVRRRTNPMTCFVNEESADRILYAISYYVNQRWAQSLLKEFTHKS
jgi:transposase-like protein